MHQSATPASNRPRKGRTGLIVGLALAVVVIVAAVVAAMLLLSPDKRAEGDIEESLNSLREVSSYGEFTEKICAEYRPDTSVFEQLDEMAAQSGGSFDQLFVEQIRASWPESMEVTGVELDGDDAQVTTRSTDSEGATHEETFGMRKEDGQWKVCDASVGTGQVPQQPQLPAPGTPGS